MKDRLDDLVGRRFKWIQGGQRGGWGENFCIGIVIGIVRKGDSLFDAYPIETCGWHAYHVDRSVRFHRAVLQAIEGSKRYVVAIDKLSNEVGKERVSTAMMVAPVAPKVKKYLREPGGFS